jgi:hypothetical protein
MVYQRIHKLLESPNTATPSSSLWQKTFSRRAPDASPVITELVELVRIFPKLRYQSLIMQQVTGLYVSLRGLLSDQLREVDYCRTRLGELLTLLAVAPESRPSDLGKAGGRFLFTEGSQSLEEAIRKLENKVGAAELVELDARMQTVLRKQFKALVHVCMSSANMLKSLAPAMERETRAFLRTRLGEMHVADIYLGPFGEAGAQEAAKDLAAIVEEADPEVAGSASEHELNILAVPPGGAEKRLRQLADQVAAGAHWVIAPSTDEIVIYREHTLRCLADLKQLGHLGQEAYKKLTAQEHFTPHSRSDIIEWGT